MNEKLKKQMAAKKLKKALLEFHATERANELNAAEAGQPYIRSQLPLSIDKLAADAGVMVEPIRGTIVGRSPEEVLFLPPSEVEIDPDDRHPRDIERDQIRRRQADDELKRLLQLGEMESFRLLQLDLEEADELKAKAFQAKADEIISSRQKDIEAVDKKVEEAMFDPSIPVSTLGELFSLQQGLKNPEADPESLSALMGSTSASIAKTDAEIRQGQLDAINAMKADYVDSVGSPPIE